MSYISIKVISIVIMMVILILVVIMNKSDKKKEIEAVADNTDQQPEDSEYQLPHEQENKQSDPEKVDDKQSDGNPVQKPEISDALKRENRRFMKAYLSMSEWEKNKIRGEENPRTPEEEQAYWEEFERRKKEHYELLMKYPNHQHHCMGFDLPTAAEAYEHFHGLLEELWDYGDKCNENYLHTWDDGGRKLCLCHDCGGLVLVQKSEYHGQENDDYYTDYFPVDSVQEAEQMNYLYSGYDLETKWKGKKVLVTNGKVMHDYD